MRAVEAVAIDAERQLGRVALDVLDMLHGEAPAGAGDDALTQALAEHALVAPVRGCVLGIVDEAETFRVAGVAGHTGRMELGTRWPLSGSVVSEALAQRDGRLVEASHDVTAGGRALAADGDCALLTLPLRVGDRGPGEPTSLGALVLLVDRGEPLGSGECRFFDGIASLASLVILNGTPAHHWLGRASRLRRSADAAVDAVRSLDEGAIPRLLRQACEGVSADRATLLRRSGGMVVVEGVHDSAGLALATGITMPLEEHPMLQEAFEVRDVVLGGQDELDGSENGRAADSRVRHSLVMPLVVDDEVAGFITVARRHLRPFVADDAATLEFLGQVAILTLRNSRLFADAQAASSAMSGFLRLTVHDLRAPLTVLSGYVELMRNGTLGDGPKTWEKPLTTIAAKIQETQRLVDDLLLAARLESGAISCRPQVLELNEVIARAAERAEPRALLAGGSVETVPSGTSTRVSADGFYVDRVMDNLVNNALSYGGESPRVRISVDSSDPPALRVGDSGVGISKELHTRVFEPYFRVDGGVPGTGFGLHVGRVLAEACGGRLLLERSAPNEGSVFRLELPAFT